MQMPIAREPDVSGIILVGGRSRRMGEDKALLEIAGKPLFKRVLDLFTACFDKVQLVGDRGERFTGLSLPIFADIYPGSSLGGLYTGLLHARTGYIFVAPCDLPFPNGKLLRYICSLRDGFDAVVPESPRGPEPLFALYSGNCLLPMQKLLETGNLRIRDLYPHVRVRYVPYDELAHLDEEGRSFLNINTPHELARVREELPE